jgi:hypothetical protein
MISISRRGGRPVLRVRDRVIVVRDPRPRSCGRTANSDRRANPNTITRATGVGDPRGNTQGPDIKLSAPLGGQTPKAIWTRCPGHAGVEVCPRFVTRTRGRRALPEQLALSSRKADAKAPCFSQSQRPRRRLVRRPEHSTNLAWRLFITEAGRLPCQTIWGRGDAKADR